MVDLPLEREQALNVTLNNAQVGSETERIASYRRIPREKVLEEITDLLKGKLVAAGANPDTVKLADVEETSVSYMADESTRIRVKMVGDLSFDKHGNK